MDIKFERQDTKAIKGIAVLMMLFTHLVAVPDRYPVGFEGFVSLIPGFVEGGYLEKLAVECGLCVPFFFFLGGYGLFIRVQRPNFSLRDTIMKLYFSLWKVFFVFIPIGFLFFSSANADVSHYIARFSKYHGMEMITVLISDFTGLTCKLNGEWWFFGEYVRILIVGYLFCKATSRIGDFWTDLMIVFGMDFLIRSVIPQLPALRLFSDISDNILYVYFMKFSSTATSFFAGIVMAKYGGMVRIKKLIKGVPFHPVLCFVGLAMLVLLRCYVMGPNIDTVLCSFMIPMISLILDALPLLKRFFAYMGKHSTNMWLIHSFFCFYYLEFTYLVYSTRSVIVNMIILTALSCGASVLLEAFYRQAGKWVKRYIQTKSETKMA